MAKIIFTFRPVSLKKPISLINAGTRIVQGYPRDHVSLYKDGEIYESVVGAGVQKIPFDEWYMDRIGTDVAIYEVPDEIIDWDLFDAMLKAGIKYDLRAIFLHLIGKTKRLMKNAEAAVTCSELMAMLLGMENAYKATPKMVEEFLREIGYPSVNDLITPTWQV
jgi:hypothetical protein